MRDGGGTERDREIKRDRAIGREKPGSERDLKHLQETTVAKTSLKDSWPFS